MATTYAYFKELESGFIIQIMIFEISEEDINAYECSSETQMLYYLNNGGKLTPPYRDYALGFDAGFIMLCLFQII